MWDLCSFGPNSVHQQVQPAPITLLSRALRCEWPCLCHLHFFEKILYVMFWQFWLWFQGLEKELSSKIWHPYEMRFLWFCNHVFLWICFTPSSGIPVRHSDSHLTPTGAVEGSRITPPWKLIFELTLEEFIPELPLANIYELTLEDKFISELRHSEKFPPFPCYLATSPLLSSPSDR